MKYPWRTLPHLLPRFAPIAVLIAGTSLSQELPMTGRVVVLQQQLFSQPSDGGRSLIEHLSMHSPGGESLVFEQVPPKAMAELTNLAVRIIPFLELRESDPRDVIRLIVRKPTPKQSVRLGRVGNHEEPQADPSWVAALSFGDRKLSCAVTNVSLLELSVALSAVFECDFGVTPDGQTEFRNRHSVENATQPLYTVTVKPTESR